MNYTYRSTLWSAFVALSLVACDQAAHREQEPTREVESAVNFTPEQKTAARCEADCGGGNFVSCTTQGRCVAQDAACPGIQGYVDCGWGPLNCPVCPGPVCGNDICEPGEEGVCCFDCPCGDPPPCAQNRCEQGRTCEDSCDCGPGSCVQGTCDCEA